jgi:hypothetical protein
VYLKRRLAGGCRADIVGVVERRGLFRLVEGRGAATETRPTGPNDAWLLLPSRKPDSASAELTTCCENMGRDETLLILCGSYVKYDAKTLLTSDH